MMETETITFDSDGDLLLLLSCAVEEPEVELSNDSAPVDLEKESQDGEETPPTPIRTKEVRMLVSSKHLIHVSVVFKAMLRNQNFKEGVELARGKAEVPLPDDDPTALRILLYLIHHNYRKVPREVDLKTMTNIAILADKYQMTEVLYTHSEIWLKELKKTVPTSLTDDLLPWLAISCVFSLPPEFKHLTRIATMESSGFLEEQLDQELPIPNTVFAVIDTERQRGLSEMFAVIQQSIDKYQAGPVNCQTKSFRHTDDVKKLNYACDGSVLGTLLKNAADKGLWPSVSPPYEGLTLRMVMKKAQSLNITALCDHAQLKNEKEYEPGSNHGVKATITATVKKIKAGLGLNIRNFKSV
ncbi:hypothetical protein BJ875DRAFT_433737 [Amylocarpus encephaloides]|uniref:BTB domain-containing protein n=1 Tax=Amylocarpus encephaloides TaxID=45428 RepID=A0A9P7Y8Z0_9HELO|nr:hypothetical protein BJ875DRAFT_433737 [Amylocarpus encephaloides]